MVINSTLRRRRHTFNLNSYYPQKRFKSFLLSGYSTIYLYVIFENRLEAITSIVRKYRYNKNTIPSLHAFLRFYLRLYCRVRFSKAFSNLHLSAFGLVKSVRLVNWFVYINMSLWTLSIFDTRLTNVYTHSTIHEIHDLNATWGVDRYTWISVPNSLAVSIPFPSSFCLIFTDFLYHSCEIKSLSIDASLQVSRRGSWITSIRKIPWYLEHILQTLIICVHKEIDFNRMW